MVKEGQFAEPLRAKPVTLQAAGRGLAINVSAAATITVTLEWTETPG
jgi:hypothetical protein